MTNPTESQNGADAPQTPSPSHFMSDSQPATQHPALGDFPGKTLGIVGLIISILVSAVGLVISIIAHNQSRRAGYKNGPATAGIIVGAALTGISLIVLVFSIVVAALVVGTGTGNATSNVVGACLNSPSGSIPLSRAPRADCSQPHDYEIYKVWDFPAEDYPGDEVVTPVVDDTCRTSFETFVGIPHSISTLAYSYEAPSGGSSQDGNHRAYCFISDPAGKVSGSLAGSKR